MHLKMSNTIDDSGTDISIQGEDDIFLRSSDSWNYCSMVMEGEVDNNYAGFVLGITEQQAEEFLLYLNTNYPGDVEDDPSALLEAIVGKTFSIDNTGVFEV